MFGITTKQEQQLKAENEYLRTELEVLKRNNDVYLQYIKQAVPGQAPAQYFTQPKPKKKVKKKQAKATSKSGDSETEWWVVLFLVGLGLVFYFLR